MLFKPYDIKVVSCGAYTQVYFYSTKKRHIELQSCSNEKNLKKAEEEAAKLQELDEGGEE